MNKISPSILSADFANLEREIKSIVSAGADMIHIDVMDGIFVPNISIGFPVIKSIRKITQIPFDVHLMISNPGEYIERFINAGADILTFHYEATDSPEELLDKIHSLGKKAGISIKPNTEIEDIFYILDKCDMVLVMTVEPGFGGQKLIPNTIEKVKKLSEEIYKRHLNVEIEVDGGISDENVKKLKEAGANIFVAGSYIFASDNYMKAIDSLR